MKRPPPKGGGFSGSRLKPDFVLNMETIANIRLRCRQRRYRCWALIVNVVCRSNRWQHTEVTA